MPPESITFSPETIEAISKIMGTPINSLSTRMDNIESSNKDLAKEIHSTLRHLDLKYVQSEKLVERAEHEAARATDAADNVEDRIKMCRDDEEQRIESVVRRVFPEILKEEVPKILHNIKPKTDWARNLSIIIASLVLTGGIITGVGTIVTDKSKITLLENQAIETKNTVQELKKVIIELKSVKE